MARLPRLALPQHAHYIIQRGHSGRAVFADAEDRADYLAALRAAAAQSQVQLHAWALLEGEVQLLATPALGPSLGQMLQAVGRRYVSAYNRRHGRSGTLWDGRFRCAVVEPGAMRLAALRLIDGQSPEPGITSAAIGSVAHPTQRWPTRPKSGSWATRPLSAKPLTAPCWCKACLPAWPRPCAGPLWAAGRPVRRPLPPKWPRPPRARRCRVPRAGHRWRRAKFHGEGRRPGSWKTFTSSGCGLRSAGTRPAWRCMALLCAFQSICPHLI